MRKLGNVSGSRRKLLLTAFGIVAIAIPILSSFAASTQNQPQSHPQASSTNAPKYEFDTASIKPTKLRGGSFMPGFTVDGYRSAYAPLQTLIIQAYGVRPYQISGAPSWMISDLYDVEAKMDPSVADALKALGPDQLKLARQQMLQALLADRFALKVHTKTKDGPVYLLNVGKNGPRMQDAKPAAALQLAGPDGGGLTGVIRLERGTGDGTKVNATSVNIPYLTRYLSQILRRPVLDKTGLTGSYDFTLDFVPDAGQTPATTNADDNTLPPDPGASIFTAVQQQLGLKLDPGRGPVGTLVIDHVERPSGNESERARVKRANSQSRQNFRQVRRMGA
jgi:uncharacterized protein (TIGR03435 family)